MKNKITDNKFIINEVFNPDAITIEEKMKEIFEIYLNEKLVNVINKNESKIKMIENKIDKIKKYIDKPNTVDKIKSIK